MQRRKRTSLGSVSSLVFCAAFRLIGINGSFHSYSYSSSSTDSVTFPNCSGTTSFIGDGDCDDGNNNVECAYDGGDCCACSCISTTSSTCGRNGFDCRDPQVGEPTLGCEVVPVEPPAVSPCATGTPRHWVVQTTADADSLADSMLCAGGIFDVEWKGYVPVSKTLYAIDGTVLHVVGSSDAVADGCGTTQLFSAVNGSLRLSNLEMSNGDGIHGGAISATQRATVTLSRVNFSSNTATGFGGAIHVDGSSLELANSSSFTGNSAAYGGAIYMANTSTLMQHMESGAIYRFIDNTATDGGGLYVSGASRVEEYTPKYSTSTRSYYGSVGGSAICHSASNFDATVDATLARTCFFNNTAQSFGGAVYIDDGSGYSWAGHTTFERNDADYGGALFIGEDSTVQSQGVTLFAQNRARSDGGAVASAVDDPYPHVYFDGAVSFLNNTCGGSGGALALFGNMDFDLGDTTSNFSGNSAALFGGAIYLSAVTDGHQLVHARFTQNQAQNGGAVLAGGSGTARTTISGDTPTFHPTNFSSCTFLGNSALESGGAIEIAIGRAHVEHSEFVWNIANAGGALRIFGTVDLFNSSFSDNMSAEGHGSAISNLGVVSGMDGLSFSGNRFSCAATEYVDSSEGDTRFAAICQGCDTPCQGCFIEDNTTVPTCTAMFENAHSENGTATIEGVIVQPGYWRANNQSENVLPCYNADACLGGLTGDPGYCSDGYEGPYCSVCSKHYTATLAFSCGHCGGENVAVVILVLAIASIAAVAFVWYMVSTKQEGTARGRVEKVLPLQSIKIVVVVWQIVAQFSSAAQVIYPASYQRLLGAVAFLVNFDIGWMLSAGCVMDVDFHDGLLVATIGPIVVIAILGITYTVAINRNRGSNVALHAVRRKHLGAIVLWTFFIYSSVSSAVFRTFACDKLDDGTVYLRTDYRIEYDSPRHKAFTIYAGLMVLVYPVGIPLFYTILLFRENGLLIQGFDRDTRRYDFTSTLRKPYRPSVFYYEVVECCRRILLTGVVVFIYPNTAPQIAVMTMVAFTFVLVSEGLNPYASRWDSWVSRAGHVIVFLSMYVALLLKVDISNESQREQNIFAGILVAAHGAMILLVIVETMALLYSMRNQEKSLPVSSRSSSAKLVRSIHGPPVSDFTEIYKRERSVDA